MIKSLFKCRGHQWIQFRDPDPEPAEIDPSVAVAQPVVIFKGDLLDTNKNKILHNGIWKGSGTLDPRLDVSSGADPFLDRSRPPTLSPSGVAKCLLLLCHSAKFSTPQHLNESWAAIQYFFLPKKWPQKWPDVALEKVMCINF